MSDYERIEKAINFLKTNFKEQPALADLAKAVHLSDFHFQRLFTQWAGVSVSGNTRLLCTYFHHLNRPKKRI